MVFGLLPKIAFTGMPVFAPPFLYITSSSHADSSSASHWDCARSGRSRLQSEGDEDIPSRTCWVRIVVQLPAARAFVRAAAFECRVNSVPFRSILTGHAPSAPSQQGRVRGAERMTAYAGVLDRRMSRLVWTDGRRCSGSSIG